jgi:hypothetical protein
MKKIWIVAAGIGSVIGVAACSGSTADGQTSQTTQAQTTGASASGEAGKKGPHHHGHHTPPPAAFEACAGKVAGDTCTVALHDQALAGKCVAPPVREGVTETRILCRPDKMPEHAEGHGGPGGGHPHGPPPPEVFTACEGKSADQACTVKVGDHGFDGTCRTPPPGANETRLGCAPTHLPKP